ncbi:MAG: HAD family hydrolase [Acidobacteriota bacterium]
MNLNNIELITFDCYGTLIDWEGGITNAFQTTAARDGIRLSTDDIVTAYMLEEPIVETESYRSYREVLTETARRVAARLGWQLNPSHADFLVASMGDWIPFSDTNAALERLAKRFQLGILSNVDDDLLAATRRHFTVNFDLIVTAAQVKSYKPGHAHFQEAITRRGGKQGLLHAAQSHFHDVVPATTLGIPVVWVNRKNEPLPSGGPRPTYQVHNLAGLAELMLNN